MTPRQKFILEKTKEQIRVVRSMLDDIMYRTDHLPEDEFNKIRNACDNIDEAYRILP
jgi:hypothetical protein